MNTRELRLKLLNLMEQKMGKNFMYTYMKFQVVNPIVSYDDPIWLQGQLEAYATYPDYKEI